MSKPTKAEHNFSGADNAKNKADYWRRLAKTHPKKAIESANALWELACGYFAENAEEDYNITQLIKGGHLAGSLTSIPAHKPLSWQGFEIYLRAEGVINTLADYRNNTQGRYEDYQPVIRDITSVLFDNKFSGAANGEYDAGTITRELGLINKEEKKLVAEQPLFSLIGETAQPQMPQTDPLEEDPDFAG